MNTICDHKKLSLYNIQIQVNLKMILIQPGRSSRNVSNRLLVLHLSFLFLSMVSEHNKTKGKAKMLNVDRIELIKSLIRTYHQLNKNNVSFQPAIYAEIEEHLSYLMSPCENEIFIDCYEFHGVDCAKI